MRLPVFAILLFAVSVEAFGQESESPVSRYDKPSVGIVCTSLETVRNRLKDAKLPGNQGVMILGVYPNSGAAIAGLKTFDIVTMIGGKRVSNPAEVAEIVDQAKIGESLVIKGYGYNNKKNSFASGSVKAKVKSFRDVLSEAVKSETDSLKGVTFYESPVDDDFGERSILELYASEKQGAINPRVRLSIVTSDWIFAKRIYLKSGDVLIEKDLDSLKGLVERKTKILGASRLLEWYDWTMDSNMESVIEQACRSGQLLVRFEGDTVQKEFKPTVEDIYALRLMMDFINMKREKSQ
jgi:hypothetical protein